MRPAHVGPRPELIAEPAGIARRFYVSNAGDDAADGAAPGRPFRTLAHAARDLRAGDALLLRRGDTFREPLDVTATGEPGSPVYVGP